MTEGADFLSIHPIEEAFLASITPSPHITVISKRNSVILAHRDIDHLVLREPLYESRLIKGNIFFIAMTEHAPLTNSKCVQLAFFRNHSRVAHANAQFLHVQIIELRDSLWHTFWHLKIS